VPGPAEQAVLLGGIRPIAARNAFAPLDSYRLRPGDYVGFVLHIRPQGGSQDYQLTAGDRITVEYLHLAASERRLLQLRVKPDGAIDLPMIGAVPVAGQTIQQVTEALNERARKYWKQPQVVVVVTDPQARYEELRRSFSVGGVFNQTLSVPVAPDGSLTLPLIGTVRAFGQTIDELREEVTRRYDQEIPGVEVTPLLQQRAPDRVYVLGEVAKPGMLALDRPSTVIQAIAQSGGFLLSAELHEVVLIRGYTEGQHEVHLLDLHKAIERKRHRQCIDLSDDCWLQDGDIVVIPKDHLQNVDDFVDRVLTRGVYGLVPFPRILVR
jgi:polysaccharide export outer membrane protein